MAGEVVAAFEAELNTMAEAFLRDFLNKPTTTRARRSKEINDPVWGTIVLQAPEVYVLDSPLLQRLRRIRQLGVVHLVFPGAIHTRFDHSIGIVSRVSALADALNSSAQQHGGLAISPERQQLLRLAALCHDVGHGFMSHVSEKALDKERRVNALQREFYQEHRVEGASLSEMSAFYLMRSPAARELVKSAWLLSALPLPSHDITTFISNVIIGKVVADDVPLLHELVTGPFDGDKLDYLSRDAYFTGVPKIVDIQLLVQKIRAAVATRENLPREIGDKVSGPPSTLFTINAVALSGASTLDELALARALLHDKVYRHQKVRSAEAMVASTLSVLADLVESPATFPLRLHDEEYLDLDIASLTSKCTVHHADSVRRVATAADLIGRLRDRELFVRAFSWSQAASSVEPDAQQHEVDVLRRLLTDMRRSPTRSERAGEMATETANILRIIGDESRLQGFDHVRLKNYIWIDPPTIAKGRSLLNRAYLSMPDESLRRFGDVYTDTDGWSDQYLVNREIGFVFAPREIAVAVHLAAERVLRIKQGLRVDRDTSLERYVPANEVEAARAKLAAAGYYSDAPCDLLPIPESLGVASASERLEGIVAKLRAYAAPTQSGTLSEVSKEAVFDFVRQFREPALVDEALRMLEKLMVLQRGDVASAVREFLVGSPEFNRCVVCPLGGPNDSSAIHTYVVGDIGAEFQLRQRFLHDLEADEERLLLVDDFIGSGRQVTDIFETWLGLPRSFDLGEQRAALPDEVQVRLRRAEIGIVFAAGLSGGVSLLQDKLTGMGLNAKVHVRTTEAGLPALEFGDSGFSDEFRSFCSDVGRELLSAKFAEEVVTERTLGYGNLSLLVVLPMNTPAQTLTLLWESGTAKGGVWVPLLHRRRKT